MIGVKVCGMTRVEDVRLAGELGAGAIGFVLWPRSPRYRSPRDVRILRDAIPEGIEAVGVFVNPSRAELDEAVETAGLSAVQLHGDETIASCIALPYPVIKAVSLDDSGSMTRALEWPDHVRVLLDVHDPTHRGGTGRVVDWTLAAAVARRRPIILAGGLTPANVAEAVETVRPAGVDVSSGVERRPGIKDSRRMRDFFDAVRQMDASRARVVDRTEEGARR